MLRLKYMRCVDKKQSVKRDMNSELTVEYDFISYCNRADDCELLAHCFLRLSQRGRNTSLWIFSLYQDSTRDLVECEIAGAARAKDMLTKMAANYTLDATAATGVHTLLLS
jgi:hypothetical protein